MDSEYRVETTSELGNACDVTWISGGLFKDCAYLGKIVAQGRRAGEHWITSVSYSSFFNFPGYEVSEQGLPSVVVPLG
ncbi:hypothetical protein T265_06665 [Opisthorchis viverrini]|uniref:Uncharacterized protein n=1 Tax=Opisthorchis viverrini TaxID=6198 RepID=A0A074ZFK2_OPIVI|nr:hypothetical protein T265_06665 [Opisthorchis viverrini]KER25968.1 hypothetical protein T265_06665 [Opisthorchis viverrini]